MTDDSPLIAASRKLAERLRPLAFTKASHVYLPLDYAREPHEEYLRRYGSSPKRVVFLGMNPGGCGRIFQPAPPGCSSGSAPPSSPEIVIRSTRLSTTLRFWSKVILGHSPGACWALQP